VAKPVLTRFEWYGDDILGSCRRAAARGTIALAETVVSSAKDRVHRLTGTLSRSIHAAPDGYEGAGDQPQAEGGADLSGASYAELPTWVGEDQAVILVGSWIAYACVEESRHPYMAPALEAVMGSVAEDIFQQAFAEEGLA